MHMVDLLFVPEDQSVDDMVDLFFVPEDQSVDHMVDLLFVPEDQSVDDIATRPPFVFCIKTLIGHFICNMMLINISIPVNSHA